MLVNVAVYNSNNIHLSKTCNTIKNCCPDICKITSYSNPDTFLNDIKLSDSPVFDLIIIILNKDGSTDISMAKNIKSFNPWVQFIFVADNFDFVEESFTVRPLQFLLQPIKKTKLINAINIAIENKYDTLSETFDVVSKNHFMRFRYKDIKYVESYLRNIVIHEKNKNTEIVMKLDDFEQKAPRNFIRTHKSYLVNMDLVKNISNNHLELFSGEIIPIAKTRYPQIKKAVLTYLGIEANV